MICLGGLFSQANPSICPYQVRQRSPSTPSTPHLLPITPTVTTTPVTYFAQSQQSHAAIMHHCAAINVLFHAAHTSAAITRLQVIEHAIVYLRDELILLRRGEQGLEQVAIAPTAAKGAAYTLIKSLSHVSVLLTVALETIINDEQQRKIYLPQLQLLEHHLEEIKRSGQEHAKPHLMLIESALTLISAAKSMNCVKQLKERLASYLQEMQAIHDAYAHEAAQLQITSLSRVMSDWQSKYAINLEHSRVLIVGPHGPRQGIIEKQYFTSLYAQDGINDCDELNIIYVEMLTEQLSKISVTEIIQKFLSKHELNKIIGHEILGDNKAMYKDILSKHGERILAELTMKR